MLTKQTNSTKTFKKMAEKNKLHYSCYTVILLLTKDLDSIETGLSLSATSKARAPFSAVTTAFVFKVNSKLSVVKFREGKLLKFTV